MSDLQLSLKQQLLARGLKKTLAAMGYEQITAADTGRLQQLMADPYRWLAKGHHYDDRYNGPDFIAALCRTLDIPEQILEAATQRLSQAQQERAAKHQPWIFVDTGFRREHSSQPLFALAAMEQYRRIPVQKDDINKDLAAQLDHVRALIAEHQQHWQEQHGGTHPVWGKPQSYRYYYSPERALVFSVEGKIIGEWLREADGASL